MRIGRLALAAFALSFSIATPAGSAPLQPSQVAQRLQALLPTRFLLLGELHNIPEQQLLQAAVVRELATQGRLHALVLEMADAGRDTRALSAQATEVEAQNALGWKHSAWPWKQYGPVVMAAVQSGVPVLGGIPPRTTHTGTMANASLDARLAATHLTTLHRLIHSAHCELLPPSQWPGMARIQIARDLSMAHTLWANSVPGKTTVLVTGQQHARRDFGVPLHLQAQPDETLKPDDLRVVMMQAARPDLAPESTSELASDVVWMTPPGPEQDHCAEWRERSRPKGSAG